MNDQSYHFTNTGAVPLHRLASLTGAAIRPIAQELRSAFQAVKYRTDKSHRHDYFEIYLLSDGGGRCVLDSTTIEVDPHSVCVLPPGTVHCWSDSNEMDGFVARVPIHDGYCLSATSLVSPQVIALKPNLHGHLQSLLRWIVDEEMAEPKNLAAQRWQLLLESIAGQAGNSVCSTQRPNDICQAFLLLLEKHYPQRRGVQDYAAELGVSRSRLLRATQNVLGTTANQLIKQRTLAEAERLLLNTSLTCIEISEMLGFPNQAQFSRAFTAAFNLSPSHYRNSMFVTRG